MYRWIIFVIIAVIVEVYTFQALKTVIKTRWFLIAYQIISLVLIGVVIYQMMNMDRSQGQTRTMQYTIALVLIMLLPKLVITVVMLLEDIFRLAEGTFRKLRSDNSNADFLPNRRKFLSSIALGLAAVPFLSLIYGITKGKYNFKVIRQMVPFADLPDAFDGFTITHISDIHSGSFDNPEKIKYAIDLINEQKSDIILFTGDIVNTHAKEMHPWIETFRQIEKPQYGKYSILGNHDYGEYVDWKSAAEKNRNFEAIKDLHQQIDFKLLLNQNVQVQKGQDRIAIVGVENWGHNFKQAGDLKKASVGLAKDDFKILMSHDPSHWEMEAKNHPNNYNLTLSGHTHGMQFGIEIPGFLRWSPAQYAYKQWAGLYENFGRYIYVNRGFGFHAFPGRVGIWPEITVLTLKKIKKTS
ncbi:MAG TPA: metallophosphoesterase [Flavobacterium sp.]|jgi:hypothetical protein